MLEKDSENAVRVKGMLDGGPAATDTRIFVKDRVLEIDYRSCDLFSMPLLNRLMQGVEGSKMMLKMQRHPDNFGPEDRIGLPNEYLVTLFRASF